MAATQEGGVSGDELDEAIAAARWARERFRLDRRARVAELLASNPAWRWALVLRGGRLVAVGGWWPWTWRARRLNAQRRGEDS